MHPRPHVIFAGGGTAGHLFPGLAVADCLTALEPRLRVTFAIPGSEFECEWVHRHGYEYLKLPSAPRPTGPGGVLRFIAANWSGYRAALSAVRTRRANVVVGLGGYGSVPMARAAAALRVPLVLLEQNVIPGKATRWLARWATQVCAAFPESQAYFRPETPLELTGNPVRADVGALARHRRVQLPARLNLDRPGKYRLVVLGGSRGAQSLNANVPFALYRLRAHLAHWQIIHQTGADDVLATRRLYQKFDLPARVEPFLADVAGVLRHADLAISRAGGTALAELACAGVPAVLVPYPHAADDHQLKNAEHFASAGACRIVDSRSVAGPFDRQLASSLSDLVSVAPLRNSLSQAMRSLAQPAAAQRVATIVHEAVLAAQAPAGHVPAQAA